MGRVYFPHQSIFFGSLRVRLICIRLYLIQDTISSNFFLFDVCIEPYKDVCFAADRARFNYDAAIKILDFLCRDGYGGRSKFVGNSEWNIFKIFQKCSETSSVSQKRWREVKWCNVKPSWFQIQGKSQKVIQKLKGQMMQRFAGKFPNFAYQIIIKDGIAPVGILSKCHIMSNNV